MDATFFPTFLFLRQADFPLLFPFAISRVACPWNGNESEKKKKRNGFEINHVVESESSVNLLTLQGITDHVLVQPRTGLVLSMHRMLCGGYSL